MFERFKKYKTPVIILIATDFIYRILGGPTFKCSRCPIPPAIGHGCFFVRHALYHYPILPDLDFYPLA